MVSASVAASVVGRRSPGCDVVAEACSVIVIVTMVVFVLVLASDVIGHAIVCWTVMALL